MPPRLVKSIYFTVDDDTYANVVNDASIEPPAPVVEYGLAPGAVYAEIPDGETKLNIAGIQDWEDTLGLCRYLLAHQGEEATIVFSPRSAGTAYFTVDAILQAPPIGGPRNQYGKFQLSLVCTSDATPTTPPEPES